ncbi:NADPH-dependent F420 reductase [Promicromonospora umidemergens]|nr:NAD(P)-binding domain-containing protein [Promicromonospora umidemergens]
MNSASRPVIGIFGAGKSGVAIARLALDAGYTVHVATSGTVEDTDQLLRFVAPGVIAATVRDLLTLADILIIAVPLRRFRELPLHAMAGHIVIDVMNYWPPIDGTLPDFNNAERPSSVIIQEALPDTAQLVKTFNHLGYHQMEDLPRPTGAPDRTALAIAGDDADAVETVARLVDDLGFEPLPAGPLTASDRLEPDGPVFGRQLDAMDMRRILQTDHSEQAA